MEVVKNSTPPINFPFFPTAIGRMADGEGDMPAAMHPIILPPVAYGAPLITPPPIDEDGPAGNALGRFAPINRRSRSPDPVHIIVSSRSPRRRQRRNWTRSPATERYRSPTPPRGRSREHRQLRSRSPSSSDPSRRSRSPSGRHAYRPRSPAVVTTLVLESGRSRSSDSLSPPVRLRTVEGSSSSSPERISTEGSHSAPRLTMGATDGSYVRVARVRRDVDAFPAADGLQVPLEALRQSTIIVRSPTSPTAPRGRSLTRENHVSASSPRRRSTLPSMSSSSSSSAAQSSEASRSRSRSRSRSPYPYGPSSRAVATAADFDMFDPSMRPRQLQATISASTDSTLPTGRGHTAFMTHAARDMGLDPMVRHSPPLLPAYEAFPLHSPVGGVKGRRRTFGGNLNDMRLFVPVALSTSPQPQQRSVTLPSRRQFHMPSNVSNTMDRDTQRTSITIGPSPRLDGLDLVAKEDGAPSECLFIQLRVGAHSDRFLCRTSKFHMVKTEKSRQIDAFFLPFSRFGSVFLILLLACLGAQPRPSQINRVCHSQIIHFHFHFHFIHHSLRT